MKKLIVLLSVVMSAPAFAMSQACGNAAIDAAKAALSAQSQQAVADIELISIAEIASSDAPIGIRTGRLSVTVKASAIIVGSTDNAEILANPSVEAAKIPASITKSYDIGVEEQGNEQECAVAGQILEI